MVKQIPLCHRISRLFQPTNVVPLGAQVKNSDFLSKSSKLMVDEGIIAPSANGFFYLLPLATRSLDKLTKLIDNSMVEIGAQKISCPTLTSSNIWEKTGRLALTGPELFHMKDRHGKNFILSPTHEESITQLLASVSPLSYKQLPLLLYQITAKFRDEARPRFGLIRTREFLMKDLYSFDTTAEAAQTTYQVVADIYHKIFETIGVNFIKVKGVSGMMGGEVSHEFHYPSSIGDDTLRQCDGCGHSWNTDTGETDSCTQCGTHKVSETKGIEVGHMFQLDTRYSKPLQALCSGPGSKEPLVMGSYGLGLTRILAAGLEVLSLPDQLRWPPLLAPFSVAIITPKEGSKESQSTGSLPEELYWRLQDVPQMENDVIVDDRTNLTIGKRLRDAQRRGFPHVVVVGREAASSSPRFELHSVSSDHTSLLSQDELISALVSDSRNQCAKIHFVQ